MPRRSTWPPPRWRAPRSRCVATTIDPRVHAGPSATDRTLRQTAVATLITRRGIVAAAFGSWLVSVMREHKHRRVVRRLRTPPAAPVLIPLAADRPEHV